MDFSNITTPNDYMEAAFLAREAARELLNRLDWMKLAPQRILELGCGLGMDAQALAKRYPQAQVCAVDLAAAFLEYGRERQESPLAWVVADAHSLPLCSKAVDLIFANLLLPWVRHPATVLREWRRVLRPEGLLLFSCLGPDTFKEWQSTEGLPFLPGLVDMHQVGDALLEEGFADPVLEVEHVTLTYRSPAHCQSELEKSGMRSKEDSTGRGEPDSKNRVPLTFELVYGHAWCPSTQGFKPDDQGVVRIPVSQLRSPRSP